MRDQNQIVRAKQLKSAGHLRGAQETLVPH